MKTILSFIILLYCIIVGVQSQTYYYNNTKTFNENGYTYQCDVENGSGYVRLYNKKNKLTYTDMVNKTTGKVYSILLNNDPVTFKEGTWVEPKYTSIVNNAFTAVEKQRLKGHKLSIILYISPETGKIMEIRFTFTSNDPFATIPVSIYRKIETQLKEQIWFIPTADAEKYNYLFYNWRQKVE